MRLTITIIIVTLLTGCSAVDVAQYRANTPPLDLFDYFTGQTRGYGIVQDRKGTLKRQFTVDIVGTIQSDGSLKLYEEFDWSDGEQSTRTWIISRNGDHIFSGTAADVAGIAEGSSYGNVLNWQYFLNLQVDETTWNIKFDDWMFLVTERVLINRAKMSKFGLMVGEVTIAFQKLINNGE